MHAHPELARAQQVIAGARAAVVSQLVVGERLVEEHATRHECLAQRTKEVALQVARDDNQLEVRARQREHSQIRADGVERDSLRACGPHRVANGVDLDVDAGDVKTRARERRQVAPAPHGDVERAPLLLKRRAEARRPASHER